MDKPLTTTLNEISRHYMNANPAVWGKLLEACGKEAPDDDPVPYSLLYETVGYIQTLKVVALDQKYQDEVGAFAIWCARQSEHLMWPNAVNAVDVAERYINGYAGFNDIHEAAQNVRHQGVTAANLAAINVAAYAESRSMDSLPLACAGFVVATAIFSNYALGKDTLNNMYHGVDNTFAAALAEQKAKFIEIVGAR